MAKIEKQILNAQTTNLESVLAALSRSKSELVRQEVAKNEHTSIDILENLITDEDDLVKKQAKKMIAEKQANSQKENLKKGQTKKCHNCSNNLFQGDKFCRICGEKVIITTPVCIMCNLEFDRKSKFCTSCGELLQQPA